MPRRPRPDKPISVKQTKPETRFPVVAKWAGLVGAAAIIVSLIAYLSGRASASDLDSVKSDIAVDKAQHANDHESILAIQRDTKQLVQDVAELKALLLRR